VHEVNGVLWKCLGRKALCKATRLCVGV